MALYTGAERVQVKGAQLCRLRAAADAGRFRAATGGGMTAACSGEGAQVDAPGVPRICAGAVPRAEQHVTWTWRWTSPHAPSSSWPAPATRRREDKRAGDGARPLTMQRARAGPGGAVAGGHERAGAPWWRGQADCTRKSNARHSGPAQADRRRTRAGES